jgi:hypothetical protein
LKKRSNSQPLDAFIEHLKNKRRFLKVLLAFGVLLMLYSVFNFAAIFEFINRFRNRFKSSPQIPPDHKRVETSLPERGDRVSVEMALNSRCTSDYDDNPNLFHWGMFDKQRKLSEAQLNAISSLVNIPCFTSNHLDIVRKNNSFTFSIGNQTFTAEKDWLMVESGMQQQALSLVCAALGVGIIFKNMGTNGTPQSDGSLKLIRMKLDAMKPSYDGSYWTASPPAGKRRWLPGNLPDPLRDGTRPLLDILSKLKTENAGNKAADGRAVGQLLWAGRGRTPHRYKSREWGMTIPTWAGLQNLTCLYFCLNGRLYQYVNWKKNRPTHLLEETGSVDRNLSELLDMLLPGYNAFIILSKTENSLRSLWEIGYQLLNIKLQAAAWSLNHTSVLLSGDQKIGFQKAPIQDPVAVVAFRKQ